VLADGAQLTRSASLAEGKGKYVVWELVPNSADHLLAKVGSVWILDLRMVKRAQLEIGVRVDIVWMGFVVKMSAWARVNRV
jgi:hypothetical protein